MAYQLEIDTVVWSESLGWSQICINKDDVSVIDIKNLSWPEILISPHGSAVVRVFQEYDVTKRRSSRMEEELVKEGIELGVIVYLDDRKVEFYRNGIGFFWVNAKGGMIFRGYRNTSNEIFFEKITKRHKDVPLSEVRKEVIDGE